MKIYLQISIILSFIVVLFSCSTDSINTKNTANDNINIIKINPTNYLQQSEKIYRSISIIPLETNDNVIIGNIEKIEICENLILVLDNQSNAIYIFDLLGNYISSINSIGDGPKEYRVITDFSFNKEKQTITILDLGLLKMLEFGVDGSFVSEKQIKFYASKFQSINSNEYLFYSDNNTNMGNEISINENIFICNKQFKLTSSFLPIKKYLSSFHMELGTPITKFKTKININIPFNDTIYTYDQRSLNASWLIDFGKYKIDESYLTELASNPRNGLNKIVNSNYVFNLTNFFESSKYVIFQYMFDKEFYDVITFKDNLSSHIIKSDLNGLFTGIIGKPMYTDENYFYSIIEPFEVLELMKKTKDSSKEFSEKFAFLSKNDNPLIVKYQFKDQF